ncbi:MT-A70-domain-containing protein [Gamsiella multidivaricata]|uniref:MT-A70-domain-containing protein n=1 Tax=Gamsiella multidivaricata TaxID=101098 RepID=UPI002220A6BF|nr:MT-A70-domain-containing protein [Gamsiella multidivaricata]KAI7817050.1 MT-A70-domain-containing protein [Gamsiella multidivaricata]
MDPPWQNASVDRMEHYRTLDLYDLFRIPILDLLRTAEVRGQPGIVAVWITNRAKIKRVVIEKLFPAWGLELAAHWTWLKVTTGGEPVLSLNNRHRKPYEGILIGRQKQQKEQMSSGKGQAFDSGSNKRLLVSVPGQHSRKPSLMKLLEEEFFPRTDTPPSDLVSCPDSIVGDNQPSTRIPLNQLELFARNLEEGVLSWGNEPIRHQYCGRTSSNPYTVQDGYLVTLDPCAVGQCNSG